jgi:hypothetical protein
MSSEKPLQATSGQPTGSDVDIEKRAATNDASNLIPAGDTPRSRGSWKKDWLFGLVGGGCLMYLALRAISMPLHRRHGKDLVALDQAWRTEPAFGAYWTGIAQKGFKSAIKGHKHHGKHDKHDKHKHHGHGHHDDKHRHGHHGDGPVFIPPKQAERIFLSVPNNDSVRE